MRYEVWAIALAMLGSQPAYGQDEVGETCSGTETVQLGVDAPKVVPYTLTFSADLASGYYCYAECRPDQTYAIKDSKSDPIKFADLNAGSQTRLITFDRKISVLKDYQVFTVIYTVRRNARATCRPAPFHKPTP